jgi:hypothetical protein
MKYIINILAVLGVLLIVFIGLFFIAPLFSTPSKDIFDWTIKEKKQNNNQGLL